MSSRIWTPEQQVSVPPSPQGQLEYGVFGTKIMLKIVYPIAETKALFDIPVMQQILIQLGSAVDKAIANEKAAQETAQGNGLELPGG